MSKNEASDSSVTVEMIEEARKMSAASKLIKETPLLGDVASIFDVTSNIRLFLKLETMQTIGSFKIRGVLNQFNHLDVVNNPEKKLVTFSAGNYGKAFSFLCSQMNLKGKVLLPESALESRIKYMESQGVETQKYPGPELLKGVDEHVDQGWTLVHPLNDIYLVAGYTPIAHEITKVVDPDIVIVCCGGGSLLAGIATGLALMGSKAQVYGVEPETANTMYQSFGTGKAVTLLSAKSIAGGLAPPFAGATAFEHCKKYVKEVVLVSDDEIKETCKLAFERGLKVELSGCAALAAVLHNKIPAIVQAPKESPLNVVCVLSGGNASAQEIADLF